MPSSQKVGMQPPPCPPFPTTLLCIALIQPNQLSCLSSSVVEHLPITRCVVGSIIIVYLLLQIITILITQFHFSSITISSYQTKPVIVHAYWDYPYSLSTQFFSSLEYFKECISQLYMFKIHYYYIYFIIFYYIYV